MINQRIVIMDQQCAIPLDREMRALLRQAIRTLLRGERGSEKLEISLMLVDAEEMQQLNREYRGIDRPTDVLSFAQEEQSDLECMQFVLPEELEHRSLGDIVICTDVALEQAHTLGHEVQRELAFLAVHGTLHLLGYDHGEGEDDPGLQEMTQRQEAVLQRLGLERRASSRHR